MRYSDFLKEHYDMFMILFDKMKIGIWITDSEGRVIILNENSAKRGGKTREELVGKKTEELIETGYMLESAALKTIESLKEESVVVEMGAGGYCVVTSEPLFFRGELDLVICIERNISEVENFKVLLQEQIRIKEKFQNELLRLQNMDSEPGREFVTKNINMLQLKETAVNIGKIDATVMITGESGTGKEVIADMIHQNSKRAEAPFIKVNCAAVPESLMESEFFGYEKGSFTGANINGKIGLFELADGGTLFLDEVGELPLQIQSKLLRAIQEKEVRRIGGEESIPVNVRIIAATNRDLKKEMEEGAFRRDLYYRLFVVPISVPPLRERKEDIGLLAKYFCRIFNEEYGFDKSISNEAVATMEKYYWPGNVRELRNVVERLVVSGAGRTISAFQVEMCIGDKDCSLQADLNTGQGIYLDEMVGEYEKHLILQAYEECGSVTASAELLHVDKSTISRKMKKYGLQL